MHGIIDTEDSGRMHGYSKVDVSTNNPRFDVVETTEDDISAVFEQAKANGEMLDGADASIDAAIDDPLSYIDYLILDLNDSIAFDPDYVRETSDQ